MEKRPQHGSANHGRHGLFLRYVANCAGKKARFSICFKRHRRHFARAMTALAVLLQNREDVFVEGGIPALRARAATQEQAVAIENRYENTRLRRAGLHGRTLAACWANAARAFV